MVKIGNVRIDLYGLASYEPEGTRITLHFRPGSVVTCNERIICFASIEARDAALKVLDKESGAVDLVPPAPKPVENGACCCKDAGGPTVNTLLKWVARFNQPGNEYHSVVLFSDGSGGILNQDDERVVDIEDAQILEIILAHV